MTTKTTMVRAGAALLPAFSLLTGCPPADDAPLADDVSLVVIRRLPAADYPPVGGLATVGTGVSR